MAWLPGPGAGGGHPLRWRAGARTFILGIGRRRWISSPSRGSCGGGEGQVSVPHGGKWRCGRAGGASIERERAFGPFGSNRGDDGYDREGLGRADGEGKAGRRAQPPAGGREAGTDQPGTTRGEHPGARAPWIGPGRRAVSSCRRRGPQSPRGDVEPHRGESGETPLRGRGAQGRGERARGERRRGRGEAGCRRCWVGRHFGAGPALGPAGRRFGEADDPGGGPARIEGAAGKPAGTSAGRSRHRRVGFRRDRRELSEELRCAPGIAPSSSGNAGGALPDDREADVGGPHLDYVGPGNADADFVGSGLAGEPIEADELPGIGAHSLGRGRYPRLPNPGPREGGKSQSMFHVGSGRPGRSRQGGVDSGKRDKPGAAAAVPQLRGPFPRRRGRATLESIAGAALGGDLSPSPPGHGELHGEEKEAPEGQGRGDRGAGGPHSQAEAQGQGQGLGLGPKVHVDEGDVLEAGAAQGCLKVPGAAAPPIKIAGLTNSMPRLLLSLRCSFAAFFADLARQPRHPSGATFSFWPVPLPYPEVLRAGGGGQRAWKKRLLNLAVAALDWLYLRRPSRAPVGLGAGTPLTKRQWAMVELLAELVGDGYEFLVLGPADLGRTASKLEDQDAILGALHRTLLAAERELPRYMAAQCAPAGRTSDGVQHSGANGLEGCRHKCEKPFGWITGKLKGKKTIAAKQIEASRVTLPPPPAFDPRPFFDIPTAFAYEHPLQRVLENPREPPPARSTIMASRHNKLELFKALAASGRLGLLDHAEVRAGISSGLFSVVKDLQRDRLILDGRGANVYERPLSHWTKGLASFDKVCEIYLPAGEVLRASGRDLRDFFYQFLVNRERTARNCLAGTLTQAELRYVFGDIKGLPAKAHVGLSTLAMGDLNACEFAQASHLGVLYAHGVFDQAELLSLATPVPRDPCMVGVIIDDLIVLERIAAAAFETGRPVATQADRRMHLADEAYKDASLIANAAKGFQNEAHSKFWGIELDGDRGMVRPARTRLWPLIAVTIRVASLGLATVGLLKTLCGSWTSIILLRRRLLSIMSLLFAAADCGALEDVVKLSPELKSELWCLISLGPVVAVDLRSEPAGFISATDASTWGGAGVRAEVPRAVVLELCRHSLFKGTWTHLLLPGHAWLREHDRLDVGEELPGDGCFEPNLLASVVATRLQYTEAWRKGFRGPEHINCKEVRAYLREEFLIARGNHAIRLLSGLDSQVALGCLVKGRSASGALNSLLEASLGPYLGCGVYPHFLYFLSEFNPSDGPTRGRPPPAASGPLPSWWAELALGNTASFDEWMRLVGAERGGFDFDHRARAASGAKNHVSQGRAKASESQAPGGDEPGCEKDCSSSVAASPADEPLGFPVRQFSWKGPRPNFDAPGALDLYSGTGGVGRALLCLGAPWVLSVDISRGPEQDLLDSDVQARIEGLIDRGLVAAVCMAPPCSSFSSAVTPAVRSNEFPRGLPWLKGAMRAKVAEGNRHADWCRGLIELCGKRGVGWVLENPDTSWLWRQRGYRRFRDPSSGLLWRGDLCFFGTPWRKRTRVACSGELQGRRSFCRCLGPHQILRGRRVGTGESWTVLAQPYPKHFAVTLALALAREAGWCDAKRPLDIVGCARGKGRIGEALNPGPRRPRPCREGDLEARPLQSNVTLAYEARLWEKFLQWCASALSDSLLVFSLCPVLAAMALRAYGNHCFSCGETLSSFRHTIIAVQRRVLGCKPYLHIAWEMVSRWEALEPPVHRCPVPEPVIKAMAFLAAAWGMQRWAAVALLSFYGLARIGEVLRCRRKDLLFPSDLLDDYSDCIFLRFNESKTSTRGRPRVQHTKVTDWQARAWIAHALETIHQDELLWPGSPSAFRYRWDLLLRCLDIPRGLSLTPGGLRGGGAVQRYRSGSSPTDLQWLMRLKNFGTLEHYLQELAAVTALTEVSPFGRGRIRTAAALYESTSPRLPSSFELLVSLFVRESKTFLRDFRTGIF